MPVKIVRALTVALLVVLAAAALFACAHPPDQRSVQQAVDAAVAGR
jgi:hypothetical protein